jgi:oligopeptide transport system substrate-binding protein
VKGLKVNRLGRIRIWALLLAAWLPLGCGQPPWNDPYRAADRDANVLYSSFSERPKYLDPVRSYSANEYSFIAQIYEPPLQYHFLKRPYQLVPLTVREVPEPLLLDDAGNRLPAGAPAARVAFSEYRLHVRPGIRYQPHPALARDADGAYLYHALSAERIARLNTLADFEQVGSRELTADDYAYQIKRLAFPRLHSPIAGVMRDYLVGFSELSEQLDAAEQAAKQASGLEKPYVDLRDFPMEGVRVEDEYTLVIRLKGKYPQFRYWLAMPFFSPMPWEADRFYSQPGLEKRNISLNWYPLGTGPFMLQENNPNLRMVMARNPNFHGETYPTMRRDCCGTRVNPFLSSTVRCTRWSGKPSRTGTSSCRATTTPPVSAPTVSTRR